MQSIVSDIRRKETYRVLDSAWIIFMMLTSILFFGKLFFIISSARGGTRIDRTN